MPILLFSYFNPIFQYGLESLTHDARAAGVDGILLTDMTPEESEQYCAFMKQNDLDCVFLATPTSSEERIASIATCSRGFVYVVSRTGITGAQQHLSGEIVPTVERVRRHTALPVAVGFGISKPEQVRSIWEIADGAVVGSAIVSVMEKATDPKKMISQVGEFCRWLTQMQ